MVWIYHLQTAWLYTSEMHPVSWPLFDLTDVGQGTTFYITSLHLPAENIPKGLSVFKCSTYFGCILAAAKAYKTDFTLFACLLNSGT